MSLIKYDINCEELSQEDFDKLDRFLDGVGCVWQKELRNPRHGVLHLDEKIDIASLNLPDLCYYHRL
ncbi:MAG: hypothetical protein K5894_04325 [Lachnospiraceae bacterium]|nr:hypothetical protein [Lachnospiraceae bacterium]